MHWPYAKKNSDTIEEEKERKERGKKLHDEKTISGEGRLADDIINKLTIYYVNVIRKHLDSVKDRQCTELAIYYRRPIMHHLS